MISNEFVPAVFSPQLNAKLTELCLSSIRRILYPNFIHFLFDSVSYSLLGNILKNKENVEIFSAGVDRRNVGFREID
jgi:hypothetical protein